jgi:sugar phosphate isomerase/epimerase
MGHRHLSRRSFLAAAAAAAPLATAYAKAKKVPIGIELYSVRDELKADLMGTVRAVAKMGYDGVEFFSPYFDWSIDQAKDVRKLLDELKIKCYSTHNGPGSFKPENVSKAIELNNILGAKFVVMASAGRVDGGLDGWKKVADTLNAAQEKFKPAGLAAGFHNHQLEFKPIDGTRPIEVLAKNTSKDVILQLDIGTCVEVGYDPAQWIIENPGRIKQIHCKEFSKTPGKGYKVLFGEGDAPWKEIFKAAEAKGGIEQYIIEQEGSNYTPMESIEKCLDSFRKMRA